MSVEAKVSLREVWEQSYDRRENFIFEAKDEVIRFLSRFVRKRVGISEFVDLLSARDGRRLKALDFGCGIGSQTIFMAQKLGIQAVGADISSIAIQMAQQLSRSSGLDEDLITFLTLGDGQRTEFEDQEFDVCICDSVLDSMPFSNAKNAIKELARVTHKYIFFSVISGHETGDANFCEEVKIAHAHEHGTIQSYFNEDKIRRFTRGLGFKVIFCQLQVYSNITLPHDATNLNHLLDFNESVSENGRYFVLLERD